MLKFVEKQFRGILRIILWLMLFVFTVIGGFMGGQFAVKFNDDKYIVLGLLLGVVVGLIFNVLWGGVLAIYVNMSKEISEIKKEMSEIKDDVKKILSKNTTNN